MKEKEWNSVMMDDMQMETRNLELATWNMIKRGYIIYCILGKIERQETGKL